MAAPEKIKLTLEMSPQLYASLETLAQKTGDDKADVLRKAIALFQVAVEAIENGKELKILESEKALELASK